MGEDIHGFYKADVERIKAAVEFYETFGPSLRNQVRPRNFATSDPVDIVEGILAETMHFGGVAKLNLDHPLGGESQLMVHATWFSEKKGRRIAAYYNAFQKKYIAFCKVCIDDESDPSSGDPSSGGGDPSPGPGDNPGPPSECPTHWCAYFFNGVSWEFYGSVGCAGLCPEYNGLPPEEGQSYYHYICCPMTDPGTGMAPMTPVVAETLVPVEDDFGLYDPTKGVEE